MRVLVTGGTGLVGHGIRNVAHLFPEFDVVFLSSKDGDLRKEDDVERIFTMHAPIDTVVHLAANVGGLFKNLKYPVEMFEDNILMNTNILRAAHNHNIQNVVCLLSTCIFPHVPQQYPITTQMLHDAPPHESNEGYAYAKRMTEVLCRAYQRQYGRRYFCVIPTNIYGRYDNFHLNDAHVIPTLIHKCYLAKQNNTPFVVSGDGSPLRQFIYSDDIAKLILWAIKEYKDIQTPLILAPPASEVTIQYVVSCIVDAFDMPANNVVYDTNQSNGQHKKTADTTQLSSLPHGVAFTPLCEGINMVVKWFIAHFPQIRI